MFDFILVFMKPLLHFYDPVIRDHLKVGLKGKDDSSDCAGVQDLCSICTVFMYVCALTLGTSSTNEITYVFLEYIKYVNDGLIMHSYKFIL